MTFSPVGRPAPQAGMEARPARPRQTQPQTYILGLYSHGLYKVPALKIILKKGFNTELLSQ